MNANENRCVVSMIAEDVSFDTDPSVLDNMIGQKAARKKISFYIRSHSQRTPIPTMLFTGSKGLGKTYMAEKVAEALGRELVEVNCKTINDDKDLIEGIFFNRLVGHTPKTILFDESHMLSNSISNLLLTILNPNKDNKTYLTYKNISVEFDFSKINVIFATTDAHKMAGPLVNRCKNIYFTLYSGEELNRILKFYLPDVKLTCNKKELANACRGRARDAFMLSADIHRYCNIDETNTLDNSSWEGLKDIFEIHALGLYSQEVQLLKILHDHSPLSSRNIAIKMGVEERNVEGELEIRPKELGLIENTARGRALSAKGTKYIEGII